MDIYLAELKLSKAIGGCAEFVFSLYVYCSSKYGFGFGGEEWILAVISLEMKNFLEEWPRLKTMTFVSDGNLFESTRHVSGVNGCECKL